MLRLVVVHVSALSEKSATFRADALGGDVGICSSGPADGLSGGVPPRAHPCGLFDARPRVATQAGRHLRPRGPHGLRRRDQALLGADPGAAAERQRRAVDRAHRRARRRRVDLLPAGRLLVRPVAAADPDDHGARLRKLRPRPGRRQAGRESRHRRSGDRRHPRLRAGRHRFAHRARHARRQAARRT
ncbi:hypothetical protein KL86PLE_100624 [uncultured Pleomorphomonas sp.]|uniref:Uncharacterized protein n=1 Tax=uncultured Pleomorphomonas sp. TaxID=442121 RepID=A0A212L4X5_9HYPH|nr:hypothetical protein KL86PLE_100624 [uncultured Pleomorphomonas sp.]